jgi:hypothetical protein
VGREVKLTRRTNVKKILLCLVLALGGCSAAQRVQLAQDLAACAVGEIPSAVSGVIPHVEAAIQGSDAQWQNEIASLELLGVSFAICAVSAAVRDLASPPPGAAIAGADLAHRLEGVHRGRDYLAAHGVK